MKHSEEPLILIVLVIDALFDLLLLPQIVRCPRSFSRLQAAARVCVQSIIHPSFSSSSFSLTSVPSSREPKFPGRVSSWPSEFHAHSRLSQWTSAVRLSFCPWIWGSSRRLQTSPRSVRPDPPGGRWRCRNSPTRIHFIAINDPPAIAICCEPKWRAKFYYIRDPLYYMTGDSDLSLPILSHLLLSSIIVHVLSSSSKKGHVT